MSKYEALIDVIDYNGNVLIKKGVSYYGKDEINKWTDCPFVRLDNGTYFPFKYLKKVGEYKLTFSDIFNHEPGTMFYMNGDRKHILIVTTEEEGGEVLELILPSNEDFKPIKMSKAYMNAYYVREEF